MKDQYGDDVTMQNVVPRLVGEPGKVRWTGEKLGASNREVYCGLLGLTEQQLVELDANGVI